MSNSKIIRMQELINELIPAAEAYYTGADEIMSNYEYDAKYDELEMLEKETGIILSGSLTQKVGFEVKSKLKKVIHPKKMLSLDKTKDREALANFLGNQEGFLGFKLDGLTCVLTYSGGELVAAVTRGNGSVGEDVLHNVKVSTGIPSKISYEETLVVRCEALISYKTFEEINAKITNVDDKYKNARNLASGSIRQLDSKVAKERGIHLIAFSVVDGFDGNSYSEKLEKLKSLGFDVVPYVKVTKETTVKAIEEFETKVPTYKYPTDGLVLTMDDIAYGESLGCTSKFPRNAMAFKWKDETHETSIVDVDWSVGRTGAITPVAVFKPVEIEGTTVNRASVHNVSILRQLKLGIGDKVEVIKANLIIPQIVKNKTMSGTIKIPDKCPVCGNPTSISVSQAAEVLMCDNPSCMAKHIGKLSHFVSRDAMNIDGLSEATLEKLVSAGIIHTYRDLYYVENHEDEIVNMEGFGKTSFKNLCDAVDKSRNCELSAFVYGLGIAQMGLSTSRDVCKALDYDLERLIEASVEDLEAIDGVGPKIANEIVNYFLLNDEMVRNLAGEMSFKAIPKTSSVAGIAGKTFCITGEVYKFKNRKELQAKIISMGGKASTSVSSKTDYLINNDIDSNSNKNQTAKKLGIPIINEDTFMKMIGE